MERYSHFFSTVHDEPQPTEAPWAWHYSVMRARLDGGSCRFHDFAILWDEDHDRRIIYVVEQLLAKDMLRHVLAVGERKALVTVYTSDSTPQGFAKQVEEVTTDLPTDSFSSTVETFPRRRPVGDNGGSRLDDYLRGIDAQWSLGEKPVSFTTRPFF